MLGCVLDFVCRVVWKWYLNFQWDVNGQRVEEIVEFESLDW